MLVPVGKGSACEDGVISRESPRVDNQSTKIAMPCGAPMRGWSQARSQARPQQRGELGWREPCWTWMGSIQGTGIELTPPREATSSKPSLCPRGQHSRPWFRRKDVSCLHLPSSSCTLVVVWTGDTKTGKIPARRTTKSEA